MANPQNFSVDIPRRCQILIDELWPQVSKKHESGTLPLNASFLLSISTPMVNLPIERIWKPQMNRAVGHLNDGVLNSNLAATIRKDISSNAVARMEFFRPQAWRYHYLDKGVGLPDLSRNGLPGLVKAALDSATASQAAEALGSDIFCSILRNGLAHGGILYLDKEGCTTSGKPVRMFCFVSTKMKKNSVVGLHFLRVGMKDYRTFLSLWTKWLQKSAGDT